MRVSLSRRDTIYWSTSMFLRTCWYLMMMTSMKHISTQTITSVTMTLDICNNKPTVSTDLLKYTLEGGTDFTRSVPRMFEQCSCGEARFETQIIPKPIRINGPFCNGDQVTTCNFQAWANAADRQLHFLNNTSLTNTKYRVYVLPNIKSCDWAGMGSVGPCKSTSPPCRVWVRGDFATRSSVYFHELGHNLGLPHAYYKDIEYSDLSDGMGSCCVPRCFAAPYMNMLGWCPALKTIQLYDKSSILDYQYIILQKNEYILLTVKHEAFPQVYLQYRVMDYGRQSILPLSPFFGCLNVYRKLSETSPSNLITIVCNGSVQLPIYNIMAHIIEQSQDRVQLYLYSA